MVNAFVVSFAVSKAQTKQVNNTLRFEYNNFRQKRTKM